MHVQPPLHVEFAGALVKLAHRRKIKPEAISGILDLFESYGGRWAGLFIA